MRSFMVDISVQVPTDDSAAKECAPCIISGASKWNVAIIFWSGSGLESKSTNIQ